MWRARERARTPQRAWTGWTRRLARRRTVDPLRHLFLDGDLERLVVDTVLPPVRHAGLDGLAEDFSKLHGCGGRKVVPLAPETASRLGEVSAGWWEAAARPADSAWVPIGSKCNRGEARFAVTPPDLRATSPELRKERCFVDGIAI